MIEPMENAPAYKASFRDLPFDQQIRQAYEHLENLRQVNGGYIASPYSGEAATTATTSTGCATSCTPPTPTSISACTRR